MIGRIRTSWRIFASGRPGVRFREHYRLRQSRSRRKLHPARLLHLTVGTVLIVLSAFFGWLPVLGWGTAILGLGMIAGEFHPVARLMDRLEASARILFKPLGRKLARLPAWAQLTASLGAALATFALVYGFYSLALGA
jgi:hypothetical protein